MKVIGEVKEFFNEHIAPPHKIISVEQCNEEQQTDDWRVLVEVIEEKEYTKKYAKDQMVGVYEVFLNSDTEVTGFSRVSMRFRGKLENEV